MAYPASLAATVQPAALPTPAPPRQGFRGTQHSQWFRAVVLTPQPTAAVQPRESGPSVVASRAAVSPARLGCCLVAAASAVSMRRCPFRRPSGHGCRQPSVQKRAVPGGSSPPSCPELAEAAALQQLAAELHAEAECAGRERSYELFHKVKAPGSRGLGAEELRAALEHIDSLQVGVTTRHAAMVMREVGADCEEITLELFQQPGFLEAARRLIVEGHRKVAIAKRMLRQEEVARKAEERERNHRKQLIAQMPKPNRDTSMWVRFCAILPYAFPLVDTIRVFGSAIALTAVLRQDATLLCAHVFPDSLVPLAEFVMPLLVLAMPTLAVTRRRPELLCFNLNQAFVLELAVLAARLFASLTSWFVTQATWADAMGVPVIPELLPGTDVFVVLMACCVLYSVSHTAMGMLPDAIPYVSAEARKSMGTMGPDPCES